MATTSEFGIFLMQCKTLLRLAEQHVPAMMRCVSESVKQGKRDLDFLRLEEALGLKLRLID